MRNLSSQIIDKVFPEERRKFFFWLTEQKKNLRSWLIILIVAILILIILPNFITILKYISDFPQIVFNWILFSWIISIVLLPFVWPQKPGDFFSDNMKSGINPRTWEFEGNWKVELDEGGKPVLSITNSERGGFAIPCLPWTDYELRFETRILNKVTAWTVRTSSLNDCVMFQLSSEFLNPHYRFSGIWNVLEKIKHELRIKETEWYSIRTLVRGAWATVFINVNGEQHMIFQKQILRTLPPVTLEFGNEETGGSPTRQILTPTYRSGSFGFRLSSDEAAQFRNIRAYRLK